MSQQKQHILKTSVKTLNIPCPARAVFFMLLDQNILQDSLKYLSFIVPGPAKVL